MQFRTRLKIETQSIETYQIFIDERTLKYKFGNTKSKTLSPKISLMVKTLLSRPNLERISRMTDLDIRANTPKEYEDIIEDLRQNIIIKKTGGRRQNIFTISFISSIRGA